MSCDERRVVLVDVEELRELVQEAVREVLRDEAGPHGRPAPPRRRRRRKVPSPVSAEVSDTDRAKARQLARAAGFVVE